MDAKSRATDPETPRTSMTWLELARHVAAMTPEQRRRLVYFCDSDTGQVYTPGLVLAGGSPPDESVQLLYEDASVITGGSFYLTQNVPKPAAPAHPADGLVLVALDLDDGEEPPADFETATGVYYTLSEVEDVGDNLRMAWYFQQELSARTCIGMIDGCGYGRDARRHRRWGARRPRHADLPDRLHRRPHRPLEALPRRPLATRHDRSAEDAPGGLPGPGRALPVGRHRQRTVHRGRATAVLPPGIHPDRAGRGSNWRATTSSSPLPPTFPSTGTPPSSSPAPGSPGSGASEYPPPSSPRRG